MIPIRVKVCNLTYHHKSKRSFFSTFGTSAFYTNQRIEEYARKSTRRITLRQLISFGGSGGDLTKTLMAANYVKEELLTRFAVRIREFQQLPYTLVMNPHIKGIYDLYVQSFSSLSGDCLPLILKDSQDNDAFIKTLEKLIVLHRPVMSELVRGMESCYDALAPSKWDMLVSETLQSRISRRLLAKQLILLTLEWRRNENSSFVSGAASNNSSSKRIGLIETECDSKALVDRVIERCYREIRETTLEAIPNIKVNGLTEATFTYIPQHVEYILYELVMNSLQSVMKRTNVSKENDCGGRHSSNPRNISARQVMSHSLNQQYHIQDDSNEEKLEKPNMYFGGKSSHPASRKPPLHDSQTSLGETSMTIPKITVTIGSSPRNISFRVSDEGGGIDEDFMENIWSYSYRAKNYPSSLYEAHDSIIVGYGLPMAKVYTAYWGGFLELQSMRGYGTDAYLRIPSRGDELEKLK